jgi:hypothetical protein
MSDNAKIGLRDLFVALITAATTITGSYFMFAGSVKQADADLVSALYDQVQQLQMQIKERDREMFGLQEQITSLRIQLSKKYEASDILRGYLDAMPHPAWIKIASKVGDDVSFVMWHINGRYEDYFDISSGRYVGRTDFDIWPHDIAKGFYGNDMLTLSKMDDFCVYEDFTDGPNEVVGKGGYVCKWVLTVDGQIAIAGQLIPDKNQVMKLRR